MIDENRLEDYILATITKEKAKYCIPYDSECRSSVEEKLKDAEAKAIVRFCKHLLIEFFME